MQYETSIPDLTFWPSQCDLPGWSIAPLMRVAECSPAMCVPGSLCGAVLRQRRLSVSAWLPRASAFGGERRRILLLIF